MGTASATSEKVLEDLAEIQNRFEGKFGRLRKEDTLAKFAEDDSLSQEARDLAIGSIERMYEGVIWEDDVFYGNVISILDVTITRYRISISK